MAADNNADAADLIELTDDDVLCIKHFCWICVTNIIARV